MKKLFRSCTALLLALCLVLGMGAVAASAAETEALPKQELVDWAKDILDEIAAVDVTKAEVVAELKALVEEAKALLARIEAVDVTKAGAVEELKDLSAKIKKVLARIKNVDLREVVPVEEITLAVGAVVVVLDKIEVIDVTAIDSATLLKKLAGEAKDALEKIHDIKFREELTAVKLEKLVKKVYNLADGKIAELEKFLAEKETELDEMVAEAKTQIADAKEKIEDAKKAREDLENAAPDAKAEAEKLLADMGVVLTPEDDLLEVLDHKIAEAEDEIAEADKILNTTVPKAQVAIDKLQAAVVAAKKAAAKLAPYAETAVEESQPVLDAMFAVYDAVKVLVGEGANAAALELQSALYEMGSSVVDYIEKVTGKRSERLDKFASKAKAELDQMYRDATQAELDCIELSKIVALGDKNAYGPAADMLGDKAAEFLGAECVTYKNMTVAGQTAAQLRANLDKYAAELQDATVITLSFNTNAFSKYAVDKVVSNTGCNWAQYIGEENVAVIEQAKTELYAKLEAKGLKNIDTVVLMVEAYAFSYVQHLVSYYPLIRDIHGMNPDAYIVMVGMHNPVEGFSTEIGGVDLPLGDFMRYLTDISNIYSLSYAMLSENKLFVDAFDIEVGNEGAYYEHVPTQDGYAEIAENIWEALGVHDHDWKLDDITDEGEWYVCQVCGAKKFVPVEHNPEDGDMIGVVIALLAVSGMGITVLKRREN